MRTSFTALLFASVLFANAQDCTEDQLAGKPGKWKAGPQGSIRNIAAADLVKEKQLLMNVQKYISSGYSPTGLQVDYSTVWTKGNEPGFAADPFQLSMYLLRFRCEPDKKGFYVEYSSATNVDVCMNSISSLNQLYAAPLPADEFRGYLRLFARPEKKDGFYYLGEEWTDNKRVKEEKWLVTYGEELPFSFLTRKEYLLLLKKKLEKEMSEGQGDLRTYLANVNNLLTGTDEDLSRIAYCNAFDEERFKSFLEEGDRYGFYPVRPNMNYYRKGLPRSAVQFVYVEYKFTVGDNVFENNINGIKNMLHLNYLKGLLGK